MVLRKKGDDDIALMRKTPPRDHRNQYHAFSITLNLCLTKEHCKDSHYFSFVQVLFTEISLLHLLCPRPKL